MQNERKIANDLEYRHHISDIIKEFPQYAVGINCISKTDNVSFNFF